MSGPEHRAELSPSELDRLEDALADLGFGEAAAPGPLDPSIAPSLPAHLRERLGEYQSILSLTREAMPMIDVRDGLLDAVIAEAQSAATTPGESRPRVGLWERLRRSFVLPGFALAVTAALLVVVLRPNDEPARLEESAAAERRAEPADAKDMAGGTDAPTATAPPKPAIARDGAFEAEAREVPEEELVDGEAGAAAADPEAKKDGNAAPPGAIVPDEKASRGAKKEKAAPAKKPTASSKSGAPTDPFETEVTPTPSPVDVNDKDALRSQLGAADKARYAGRCSDATSKYQRLRGVGGIEEARALVGLGLCAESSGDSAKASEYFTKAKALAPAIDSLIASERQKMGTTTKKSSKVDFE
ncbi:MAG: hypothetical protein R3B09_35850 [Nannocystaceae bacterium]